MRRLVTSHERILVGTRADLCLDFANTLTWRGSVPPTETLPDLAALLNWLQSNGGMPPAGSSSIQASEQLFNDAIRLREVIYRVFSGIATGVTVPHGDLAALNNVLQAMPPRHRIAAGDGRFGWEVAVAPDHLLAPVAWSAGDLLVTGDHQQLRQCANEKCLWLFLDQSKNGSRRWCDMASCGNRAKARRHYLRNKEL